MNQSVQRDKMKVLHDAQLERINPLLSEDLKIDAERGYNSNPDAFLTVAWNASKIVTIPTTFHNIWDTIPTTLINIWGIYPHLPNCNILLRAIPNRYFSHHLSGWTAASPDSTGSFRLVSHRLDDFSLHHVRTVGSTPFFQWKTASFQV